MRRAALAAAAVIVMWIIVANAYVMATHARVVLEESPVHWTFSGPLYLGASIGLLADFGTNMIVGTVVWQEVPRELLLTSRATRHLQSTGRDYERAVWWCTQLHYWDAGHCGGWVPDELP